VASTSRIRRASDGEGVEGPLTALLSRLFDRRVEEAYYDGERL
jgi:branched-chain amino acid aminotransferase